MLRMKHYLMGTDEAGYGPNLGPLVLACTVWEMCQNDTDFVPHFDYLSEFENRLAPIITDKVTELGKNGKILLIGDSKKIYQSGKLKVLAEAVLTLLPLFGRNPKNVRDFIAELAPDNIDEIFAENGQFFVTAEDLPCDDGVRESPRAQTIENALSQNDVRLCDIKTSVIFPREFNLKLDSCGNKSTLLSNETLSLVRRALDRFSDAHVTVLCDKHGARNRYVDMLYETFSEHGWIEIVTEGNALSVYKLQSHGRTVEFRFQPKADRHIPAALASMSAKLLREFLMSAFNRFWQQYLPGLQATAGYPVDALRFFGQIEEISKNKEIEKDDIWRKK
jgi:hypothetical protein